MLDLSWINSAGIDIELLNSVPLPLNETSALGEFTSLVVITVRNSNFPCINNHMYICMWKYLRIKFFVKLNVHAKY